MHDLLKLNEAQRRAVTHPKGPALVLAGPGSGKTFLVISRIRYLIENRGVSPDNILVITFTNLAAQSMQRRFDESTNGEYLGVWFGTFHSFFYHILKTYDSYNHQSFITLKEKEYYLNETLEEFGISGEKSAFLLACMSSERKEEIAYGVLPEGMSVELFEKIRRKFCEKLYRDKKTDYDDMAVACYRLLKSNPYVLKELRQKYRYIIIDEYQDTNENQDNLISLIASNSGHLMVVGDDDQSIYGFRGSSSQIMVGFTKRYPDAKIYSLENNYRSTPEIVECANKVICENKRRFSKHIRAVKPTGEKVQCRGFIDEPGEMEYLHERITILSKQIPLSEMAVLARSNRELEKAASFLKRRGIKCYLQNPKKSKCQWEEAEELLDCLRFVNGKLLHAPELWRKIGGNEHKRLFLSGKAPYVVLRYLVKEIGEDFGKEKTEMTEKLIGNSKKYKSIPDYLAHVDAVLNELKDVSDTREKEGIALMTIHASKGLEFGYVCILNVNEGTIPGKRIGDGEALEEERRLLYVGMTRAKKVLDILYLTGTKENPRLPSRFLKPILKRTEKSYSASSTNSSNSTLSKNSSNASATISYSSSSSI